MIKDETYGSQYVLNDDKTALEFEAVEDRAPCCAVFAVSVFYAARRFEAGVHPASMTVEIDGETNGTFICCNNLNKLSTLTFSSASDLLDGFNYGAVYTKGFGGDLDPVTGSCPFGNIVSSVSFARRTNPALALATNTRCTLVSNVGSNSFSSIWYDIKCPLVDRDVDAAIELADWDNLRYRNGCGDAVPMSPTLCNNDGELVTFAENP